MEADDVLELVAALDELQVGYWLDGGWGVDCLLGRQTRPHPDLDLVLPRPVLARVRALLESRGYAVVRDLLPTAVAFRDATRREVDLHAVDPTPEGGGLQRLPDGSRFHYAAPVQGFVDGVRLRCASADDQLRMHVGYEPRPVDRADVRLLSEAFGLHPPAPYA